MQDGYACAGAAAAGASGRRVDGVSLRAVWYVGGKEEDARGPGGGSSPAARRPAGLFVTAGNVPRNSNSQPGNLMVRNEK